MPPYLLLSWNTSCKRRTNCYTSMRVDVNTMSWQMKLARCASQTAVPAIP